MSALNKIIHISKINNILDEINQDVIYFEEKELNNNITVLKLTTVNNVYMVHFEQDNVIKTETLNKCNSEIIGFILSELCNLY